jgi:uncharacterized membrane protein
MSHDPLPSHSSCGPGPFRVVMRPHRSLSGAGFVILMAAISFVSFVTGIVFTWLGAWPVLGFFGLDVALVYWAFHVNYRSGRLSETIEIGNGRIRLSRQQPDGTVSQTELNATWADVRLSRQTNGHSALALASHGREHPFGAFLTDDERRELASVLWAALLDARGGPKI